MCGAIFTSIEAPDLSYSFSIRRKTSLTPFSREKLLISLYDSLKHRDNAISDAAALLGSILSQLTPHMHTAVIERDILVKVVYSVLKHFDGAAATHYQAFHPPKEIE